MTNTHFANMMIDAMQNAKREMIKTWVKTEELAAPMNAFVDAQTAYAKAAVDATDKLSNAVGEAVANSIKL
jgi:hypothetical protein